MCFGPHWMGFPLIKLGFLAVKQVAKPVAQRIKVYAKGSDYFKRSMIELGRKLHASSVQIERMAEGKEQLKAVAELREAQAVERGSDFLAEVVVYGVSAGVVAAEYFMCALACCCCCTSRAAAHHSLAASPLLPPTPAVAARAQLQGLQRRQGGHGEAAQGGQRGAAVAGVPAAPPAGRGAEAHRRRARAKAVVAQHTGAGRDAVPAGAPAGRPPAESRRRVRRRQVTDAPDALAAAEVPRAFSAVCCAPRLFLSAGPCAGPVFAHDGMLVNEPERLLGWPLAAAGAGRAAPKVA